jgi:hypothetical protein
MKQTAVDYIDNVLNELIEKFNTKDYKIARNTLRNFKNIVIDKAKEMEKEQIINALMTSEVELLAWGISAEQYYNETYKTK